MVYGALHDNNPMAISSELVQYPPVSGVEVQVLLQTTSGRRQQLDDVDPILIVNWSSPDGRTSTGEHQRKRDNYKAGESCFHMLIPRLSNLTERYAHRAPLTTDSGSEIKVRLFMRL